MSKYRYTLEDRLGELLVSPLGESNFSITWNRDDQDGKLGYKREFGGTITFIGDAYKRLLKLEQTIYRCEFQDIAIQRECSGWKDWFKGRISLNSGTWDLDGCKVSLKFESSDVNRCFEDGKNKTVNLFDLVSNRQSVKMFPAGTGIETKVCETTYSEFQQLDFYWCDSGESYSMGWRPYYRDYKVVDGRPSGIETTNTTKWAREFITLNCDLTPPVGWIMVSDDCVDESTRDYARPPSLFDCQYASGYENGNIDRPYDFMECSVFGVGGDLARFRNGMMLNDVLDAFINDICPGLTVKSDFFSNEINYVTGSKSKTNNLVLFQKSDIKRPQSSSMATKANWSIGKLMTMLSNAFNVRWQIKEGEFIIEHISFFNSYIGMDLNNPKYNKFVKGKRQYSYKEEDMPSKESWEWMESSINTDFKGLPITYDGGCVTEASSSVESKYVMEETSVDVQFIASNPDSDSSIVDDNGFVLIAAAKEPNGDYFIISEDGILDGQKLNNSLGVSQLLRDYHTYNRPFKEGIMNGQRTEFNTVRPTKLGATLTVPFCCGDDFNPDDFVRTFFGNGIVDKAVFNFKTSTISLDLLYNSYSGLIENDPPTVQNKIVRMFQNDTEIIEVTEGWTDPDPNASILSVQIITPPSHGSASVRPDFTVRYKPSLNYLGNDNFTFRIKDNWGEESNVGLVSIEVQDPDKKPKANDDFYETLKNTVLNVPANGVFQNDDSAYGFTLQGYQSVSVLGGAVILENDGSFKFTPLNNVIGVDEFTYTIIDGWGNTSTATVFITIKDPNTPVAVDDFYSAAKNMTLRAISGSTEIKGLLDNDYTPSGFIALTATDGTFTTSEGGSVIIESNGSFLYSPPNNFTGVDTFQYTVNNANGSDAGIATININEMIFIKMAESDFKTTSIGENCSDMLTIVGNRWLKDITLKFYKDSAGTIPLDIYGMNFVVYAELERRFSRQGTWNSSPVTVNPIGGTSWLMIDDFEYKYEDNGCDGQKGEFEERRYIFEDGYYYQMI